MEKKRLPWSIRDLKDSWASVSFPEYQREPTVWSLEKKQRLMDSILRDFDISSIYFFDRGKNRYDCIDGRQRLNAILSYLGENKKDEADNGFHLRISNEIFGDEPKLEKLNNTRFNNLPLEWQTKILEYDLNIVKIKSVDNQEELNLQFLRLQLGSILNAGEKLHAMTGDMRDFVFAELSKHKFFEDLSVPYRRYAKEQVASQVAHNYFSRKRKEGFRRSRYVDLQDFFKRFNKFTKDDTKLSKDLMTTLDKVVNALGESTQFLKNRAVSITVFFCLEELMTSGKPVKGFDGFLIEFLRTLQWQVSKKADYDREYSDIMTFQVHVTQASVESPAIQTRHSLMLDYFYWFRKDGIIKGDREYKKAEKGDAKRERESIEL